MENPNGLLSPKIKSEDWLLFLLVISTAISELNIIAVDANSVDAIILFLNVWTARTPFFDVSSIMVLTQILRLMALTPITVFVGCVMIR